MTTTITTTQIAERLTKGFNDVKTLSQFDHLILHAPSVTQHVVTVINFMGIELICGVYTTGTAEEINNESADWKRFVILAGQNMAFYF